MAQVKPKFDPATHLSKQGWKGKGTALKAGHATRPIPVVQKKTLSGIGKDRDQAIPFWDHIFASTAASLFSTPSTSPGSTPPPSSWQTYHNTAEDRPGSSKVSMNPSLRANKEIARRGLYSRFFKGKDVQPEEEVGEVEAELGVGTEVGVEVKKKRRKREETEEERRMKKAGKKRDETEEERKARRAAKKRRKLGAEEKGGTD